MSKAPQRHYCDKCGQLIDDRLDIHDLSLRRRQVAGGNRQSIGDCRYIDHHRQMSSRLVRAWKLCPECANELKEMIEGAIWS